jgi:hypothetical protein
MSVETSQLHPRQPLDWAAVAPTKASKGLKVRVLGRAELLRCPHWRRAFAQQRKDRRFYELIEDTLGQDFEQRYFALLDEHGEVRAVQPFLIIDQDLLGGIAGGLTRFVSHVRRIWPRFLRMRTLMVGCAAGEGHLDANDEVGLCAIAHALANGIFEHARDLKTSLVVLKEFPASYRASLQCFVDKGFARVPSLPMVSLNIDYPDFDHYANRVLSRRMRYELRKKFRKLADADPIEMSRVEDVRPLVDDLYPLYLQVYERSDLHFEKLTKEFLCGLSERMSDKVRFFVWRQRSRIVAFNLSMVQGDAIYSEYIGLDYTVALDLHLYFVVVRDVMAWAMAKGYKTFHSSGLNYDPKYRLRFLLSPLDLYVRHRSRVVNWFLARLVGLLEPTRYDQNLKRFANYRELHAA